MNAKTKDFRIFKNLIATVKNLIRINLYLAINLFNFVTDKKC